MLFESSGNLILESIIIESVSPYSTVYPSDFAILTALFSSNLPYAGIDAATCGQKKRPRE